VWEIWVGMMERAMWFLEGYLIIIIFLFRKVQNFLGKKKRRKKKKKKGGDCGKV
jgi:ABC-type antimicrobial peptide transport system permease subunit